MAPVIHPMLLLVRVALIAMIACRTHHHHRWSQPNRDRRILVSHVPLPLYRWDPATVAGDRGEFVRDDHWSRRLGRRDDAEDDYDGDGA
jgi:hypothetical protein